MALSSFKFAGIENKPISLVNPNANFSNAQTGAFTDGGINYKFVTFNSSSTLIITTAGVIDVFILAGGGGTWGSGGGAGGLLLQSLFLNAETYTISVGAGGAGGGSSATNGVNSVIQGTLNKSTVAIGGGRGTVAWQDGQPGGCGGGAAGGIRGLALFNQGNDGGGGPAPGTYNGGGGQGGAGQVNGGNGGAGISSTFTGSAVSRAAGGRGASGTVDGTFWTGAENSGDGGRYFGGVAYAGNSGVVVVRVKV